MAWGIILIIYVVPFWIWQISRHEAIEARKRLYPGREQEDADNARLTRYSLIWCAGLAILVATWYLTK